MSAPHRGKLSLVSIGPGHLGLMAPDAATALQNATDIVAYPLYLDGLEALTTNATIHPFPLTQERERAAKSIELATQGHRVCLLSSGDIGIYGMAPLVFEMLTEKPPFDLQVIPGITAASACASLLGAPLSHDFATLSLSDLLCPKEWILHRAAALAEGDIVTVLYNVQSKTRQELVYRILETFLERRSPDTPCGIVRNAYRNGQSTEIVSLRSLLERKFDMFTTLTLGNSRTRTHSGFLFGPRGYLGWNELEATTSPSTEHLEPGGVWVFSGTRDGNQIAREITNLHIPVTISTATNTGATQAATVAPSAKTLAGSLGESRRSALINHLRPHLLVDATHPFALRIQAQLRRIAHTLSIPLVRWERPSLALPPNTLSANSLAEATQQIPALGQRILLTTGSRDLSSFTRSAPHIDWFCRIMPDVTSIEAARAAGIPAARILAMVGSFSKDLNTAILRDWQITGIVTKESGAVGGLQEKIEAASLLNIPLLVIHRPNRDLSHAVSNMDDLLTLVRRHTSHAP